MASTSTEASVDPAVSDMTIQDSLFIFCYMVQPAFLFQQQQLCVTAASSPAHPASKGKDFQSKPASVAPQCDISALSLLRRTAHGFALDSLT
jgi:hypothetical protein